MIRKYKTADQEEVIAVWLSSSIEAHPFIDEKIWKLHTAEEIIALSCTVIPDTGEKGSTIAIGRPQNFTRGSSTKPSTTPKKKPHSGSFGQITATVSIKAIRHAGWL